MAETTYIVTAPLVVLRNPEQGGRQEYVYGGSPLPSFVTGEDRKRLVDEGHVATQGAAEKDGVTPITTPDEVDASTGYSRPAGVKPASK